MDGDTEPGVLITLEFPGRKCNFKDIYELRKFIQTQRNEWSWLEEAVSQEGALAYIWGVFCTYLNQIDEYLKCHQGYEGDKDRQNDLKRELM